MSQINNNFSFSLLILVLPAAGITSFSSVYLQLLPSANFSALLSDKLSLASLQVVQRLGRPFIHFWHSLIGV